LILQEAKRADQRHVLCVIQLRRTGFGRLHSNGHFAVPPLAAPGKQRGHTREGAAKGQREYLIGNRTERRGFAMFLSALELRNIIESSFLPKRCQCTLSPDLSMSVKVFGDNRTDQAELYVSGINASRLNSCREINNLIAELRSDLALQTTTHQTSARSRAV
jgi:hypothetical protein